VADQPASSRIPDGQLRRRVKLARMEADMAYFQARLEILGEPRTANQLAQRRAFKMLYMTIGHHIIETKRRMTEQQ
jgi:hypothetical protein